MKLLFRIFLSWVLASSPFTLGVTYAQTPSVAKMGVVHSTTPEQLLVQDRNGNWAHVGYFTPGEPTQFWGVSILDFGAVCDGTTADDTAINAAMAVVAAASGSKILIPASTAGCVDTTSITVTTNNVHIVGVSGGTTSGLPGATLVFNNGGNDDFVIGFQTGAISGDSVENLLITHGTKSGGAVIDAKNVNQLRVSNIYPLNFFNGFSIQQDNNTIIEDVDGIAANGASNQFGFKWFTPPSVGRSDFLTLRNFFLNMHSSTGDGVLLDGFVQTINGDTVGLINTTGNCLHVANSYAQADDVPDFGTFVNLQCDGGTNEAIRIEAGHHFTFNGGLINSRNDSNASDAVFDVLADLTHSITRGIVINGVKIYDGGGSLLKIDSKQNTITGNQMWGAGFGSPGTVPDIDIGGDSEDTLISGNIIGHLFGDAATTANYNVQIESGAHYTTLGVNDYRLPNGTGFLNDLGGINTVIAAGGIDTTTAPRSPYMSYGGPGAVNLFHVTNAGTTSGTDAAISVALTNIANAYLQEGISTNGTNPSVTVSTGSAVTGNFNITANGGGLNLTSNNDTDITSTTGVVNVISSTGAVSVVSNGNVTLEPVNGTGDAIIGSQVAQPTNTTTGFVHLPGIVGTPTGTPTGPGNNDPPCIIDTAASKIWCSISGVWKYAQLN